MSTSLLLACLLAPLVMSQQPEPSASQKLPLRIPPSMMIQVTVASSDSEPKVDASGRSVELISDEECKLFGITEIPLKHAITAYKRWPTGAWLHSPTDYDLYENHNWRKVHRIVEPINATIIRNDKTDELITIDRFINKGSRPATFRTDLQSLIKTTCSNTWSEQSQHAFNTKILFEIVLKAGSSDTTSYYKQTYYYGTSNTMSTTRVLASGHSLSLVVQPGQGAVATLSATKRTMEILVVYAATLKGRVATYFSDLQDKHFFWAYDVNHVMKAKGLSTVVMDNETIRFEQYYDFKVEKEVPLHSNRLRTPSGIVIEVNKGPNDTQPTVNYHGASVALISDEECDFFGITNRELKYAVQSYMHWPDEVYVRSPTRHFEDLYQTHNWTQVERVLKAVNATVLSNVVSADPITMYQFTNKANSEVTHTAQMSVNLTNIFSNTWENKRVHFSDNNVFYDFYLSNIDDAVGMDYTKLFGATETETVTHPWGSNSSRSVSVPPGNGSIVALAGFKVTTVIQLYYEASLTGVVAAHFREKHQDKYFWGFDVNKLLTAAALPLTQVSSETVTIQYYYNYDVLLKPEI